MIQNLALSRLAAIGLCVTLFAAGCGRGRAAPAPTETPIPTAVPPTSTAAPTAAPTATKKPSAAPTPEIVGATAAAKPAGALIQVRPITATFPQLDSQRVYMTLSLDGTLTAAKKPVKGQLVVDIRSDNKAESRAIEVSGDLVGTLLGSQLRGMSARSLGVYTSKAAGTLVNIASLFTVCVKPKNGIAGLDQIQRGFSVDAFLALVGAERGLPGKLVGDETIGDLAVKHYALDVAALKAAAPEGSPAKALELSAADVWLASEGGYIAQMTVSGKGALANAALDNYEGAFSVSLSNSGLNEAQQTAAPASCARPLSVD